MHPRVTDPESPDRCQGIVKSGQCFNVKVEGTDYCPLHGGNMISKSQRTKELLNYKLKNYQREISEKLDADKQFNLREEVSILRFLIQEKLNQYDTQVELIAAAPEISALFEKVEKLVASSLKIETALGSFLDRQQLIEFTSDIIGVIVEEVSDPDVIDNIAVKIGHLIEARCNK